MTNCMHCKKSVSVGLVVCGECSDLIAQQQAHLQEAMELLGWRLERWTIPIRAITVRIEAVNQLAPQGVNLVR